MKFLHGLTSYHARIVVGVIKRGKWQITGEKVVVVGKVVRGHRKAADTCIFCSRILHDDGGFGGVVAMYQLFFCGGMLSFKVQSAYPLSQK